MRNAPGTDDPNGFASNSFAKGLAVLESFDADTPFLSMAEIARRTGQDRATARRGVLTLEAMGFLRRNGRLFALSPKVLAIAATFLQASRIRTEALPILQRYATTLEADLSLSTLTEDNVLVLCHAGGPQDPQSVGPVEFGALLSPYTCATGRILLAQMDDTALRARLETADIPRRPPQSLTHTEEIADRIQTARETGYAVEISEVHNRYMGCAVALPSPAPVTLAIELRLPAGQMSEDASATYLEHLRRCAAELSQLNAITSY